MMTPSTQLTIAPEEQVNGTTTTIVVALVVAIGQFEKSPETRIVIGPFAGVEVAEAFAERRSLQAEVRQFEFDPAANTVRWDGRDVPMLAPGSPPFRERLVLQYLAEHPQAGDPAIVTGIRIVVRRAFPLSNISDAAIADALRFVRTQLHRDARQTA